jgi:hypothetical protein
MKNKQQLLEQYVAVFERLGNLTADELLNPVAWLLSYGDPDTFGYKAGACQCEHTGLLPDEDLPHLARSLSASF